MPIPNPEPGLTAYLANGGGLEHALHFCNRQTHDFTLFGVSVQKRTFEQGSDRASIFAWRRIWETSVMTPASPMKP